MPYNRLLIWHLYDCWFSISERKILVCQKHSTSCDYKNLNQLYDAGTLFTYPKVRHSSACRCPGTYRCQTISRQSALSALKHVFCDFVSLYSSGFCVTIAPQLQRRRAFIRCRPRPEGMCSQWRRLFLNGNPQFGVGVWMTNDAIRLLLGLYESARTRLRTRPQRLGEPSIIAQRHWLRDCCHQAGLSWCNRPQSSNAICRYRLMRLHRRSVNAMRTLVKPLWHARIFAVCDDVMTWNAFRITAPSLSGIHG